MNMRTCPNGHIYDEDLYPDGCPYCDPSHKVISYERAAAPAPRGPQPQNLTAGSRGEAPEKTTMRPVSQSASRAVGDDGRTVAPARGSSSGAGATVAPRREDSGRGGKTVIVGHHKGVTPVTGWLVCVEGPANLKGKSFEILDKVNTVGREWGNDIVLEDPTITAVEHARIGYDKKHREFALIPEKNSNTIYVNDQAVYSPTILATYDLIEFGGSKFLFVALCGPRFGWDSGLEPEA